MTTPCPFSGTFLQNIHTCLAILVVVSSIRNMVKCLCSIALRGNASTAANSALDKWVLTAVDSQFRTRQVSTYCRWQPVRYVYLYSHLKGSLTSVLNCCVDNGLINCFRFLLWWNTWHLQPPHSLSSYSISLMDFLDTGHFEEYWTAGFLIAIRLYCVRWRKLRNFRSMGCGSAFWIMVN